MITRFLTPLWMAFATAVLLNFGSSTAEEFSIQVGDMVEPDRPRAGAGEITSEARLDCSAP